jgi:hypothetical protein
MPEVVDDDLGDDRVVVHHENTCAHRSSVGIGSWWVSSSRKVPLPARGLAVLVTSLL